MLPRRSPWRYAKKPVVHSTPQSDDGKKLKWFFHGPNPGLNVSKLFNELVRVPEMTGKLIILKKPSTHLRIYDASILFFQLFHRSCSMTANSHVNSVNDQ